MGDSVGVDMKLRGYTVRVYSWGYLLLRGVLTELVPLPNCGGRSTNYSNRLPNFSANIPRCYKGVYVNSFFSHTARPWNSLPAECFPLINDLNGFKPS